MGPSEKFGFYSKNEEPLNALKQVSDNLVFIP